MSSGNFHHTNHTNHTNDSRVSQYQWLSPEQQILHRPDAYIGSVAPTEVKLRVYQANVGKFVDKTMIISDAVINIFLEVLHNSADNKERSLSRGIPFSGISVQMNHEQINITNDGQSIPVTDQNRWNIWIPAMLFGNYNTSSNYNDNEERKTLGRNGFGVKLVNTFSSEFSIVIIDPEVNLKYSQSWYQNKTVTGQPIIEKVQSYNNVPVQSLVSVTWKLDFRRFDITSYTQEYVELFEKYCIDVAYAMKTVVTFNGRVHDYRRSHHPGSDAQLINQSNTRNNNYLSLFCDVKNSLIIHDENYELIFVDMPKCARTLSFVNGKCMDGGIHITCAYNAIKKTIIPVINDAYNTDKSSKNKNERQFTINVGNLKRHLGLFINCRLTNPTFKSQYKVNLVSPKIRVSLSDCQVKKMLKWNFVKALNEDLFGKTMNILKADEARGRRSRVHVKNSEDANYSGGKRSLECSLILTEGESAKGYAVKWVSCFNKNQGRNFYGIFPLRGKPLNVRNCDARKIVENNELLSVKKLLGIKQDYDYSTQEQMDTLRYGSVLMMVDSDNDGSHILGLVINMFHALWPGLLAKGYIRYLKTPILRVSMGRSKINFYTQSEYDQWKSQQNQSIKFKVNYYKGLGSSSSPEIKSDFKEMRYVELSCRDFHKVDCAINLAFNSKEINARKKWLTVGSEQEYSNQFQSKKIGNVTVEDLPIDRFIHEVMIEFSKADNKRSIPAFSDGLKVSQRKALWTSFKSTSKSTSKSTNVASLVGYIQQTTKYHHGETSMQGTIICMAQSYIWKNNLAYFTEEGNYGTRNQNGKDCAAARYIRTKLQDWVRYVFIPEDDCLLELLVDENQIVEPKRLLPIIPMWLINGTHGIGTGFSTCILKHRPLDVIDSLIDICLNGYDADEDTLIKKDYTMKSIIPWYRHFTGTISLHNTERSSSEYKKVLFEGRFELFSTKPSNPPSIHITELPHEISTSSYNEYLKHLEHKGIIGSFTNNSGDNVVDFVAHKIRSTPDLEGQPIAKVFKLFNTKTTSNMVLLNCNDIPTKRASVQSLVFEFFRFRLPWYTKRKEAILARLQKQINALDLEAKLIMLVVNKQVVVFKRPVKEITENLRQHQIPYCVFEKLRITRFTREEIDKIQRKIDRLRNMVVEASSKSATQMWVHDLQILRSILDKAKLL